MKIHFTYLKIDEIDAHFFELSPNEYFDPLEENESYWDHGIEKYPFSHEYLSIPPEKLKWLIVTVSENDLNKVYRCQFLDGDKNMMQHTVDEYNNEEIILSVKIAWGKWHTTRLIKPAGESWAVYVDTIDSDDKINEKYYSYKLIKNWDFEELKAFSNKHPKNLS